MKRSLLFLFTVISISGVWAQEDELLTRREKLQQAQAWLLEEHSFTPEEVLDLENIRQEAVLNDEVDLASDFGIILFAVRKIESTQVFASDADNLLTQAWEKELRRRDLDMTKGLMNGTAGVMAVLATVSLGAGVVLFQMSGDSFSQYAQSPVNSSEADAFRYAYQTYETASYTCMITSAALYFLSSRFMFLQN